MGIIIRELLAELSAPPVLVSSNREIIALHE